VVKIGLNINIKKPKLYYRHVHIVGGLSSWGLVIITSRWWTILCI
jgi:hypothetical protein